MSKKKYSNQQIAGAIFILIALGIAIYSAINSSPTSSSITNLMYATLALGIVLVAVGKKKKSRKAP